ncbi:putative MFS family arabinose efflux permease [Saccharopolyspora lacisalsi]|uniref:Putative MFS family arabinose efflux permease n=1 Tax=Halosaccharopolyspora lacisalsi TaxID=1000566 RepID=A0A839E2I1_9PSEU|nr:MFS transporter [Halosaccharopolyspora lacisalsi]MBA8825138.1 putative MFS family arabinose efflux permease [Halosaccharopolyspora lacisalsi]
MPSRAAPHARESVLRDRSFLLLLVATLGAFSGYVLLLPVVPLWAVTGGSGEVAAGATNGVFMLITVLTQLFMPWSLRRVDHRVALGVGTLLIGVPTPLFAVSTELWPLLAVSGVRGVGFGMLTVTGSALVAELVPAAQRGRATGLYGLAVGLPNAVLLPVGVWLARYVGFELLFWVAGALPVAAAGAAFGIARVPRRTPEAGPGRSSPFPVSLLSPWLVMLAVSIAAGGLVAFLPLAVADAVSPVALLAFGVATVGFRWVAGQLGDRFGSRWIPLPSAAIACLGLVVVALAATGPAWAAVPGALGLGAGFGALQNATLVLMFDRADSATASTAWNIAYDAGNGLGSVGFGAVVAAADHPTTFTAAAVLVACGVPVTVAIARRRS